MATIVIDDKNVPLIEGGGGCFHKNTLINVPEGSKLISDIEIGDLVMSYNELGVSVSSKVTEIFYHAIDIIYKVVHSTGVLLITPNHWVLTATGDYKELKEFKIGDKLVTSDNTYSTILSIEYLETNEVYNFKVSHNHCYIANGIKVHNGGGGGKGQAGAGGKEDPNSLFSTDIAFLLVALCEGPIYRVNPNGPLDVEFNDGYIDDLLINGATDPTKYFNISNTGTIGQHKLPLFGDAISVPQRLSSPISLKKGNLEGIPREALDKQNTSAAALDAIKLYFLVGSLLKYDEEGNIKGNSLIVKVTLYDNTGNTELTSQQKTVSGKSNQPFSFDLLLIVPNHKRNSAGYRFTVEKTSDDSESSKERADVSFSGWTEITDDQISYVRTATIGHALKAQSQYKGNVPTVTQLVKASIVKVPSNYNQPILANGDIDWRNVEVSDASRLANGYLLQKTGVDTLQTAQNPVIYDGLWDGTFVYSWTQNPAWILYDIITNTTYGLGIPETNVDKYSFYEAALYNDACDVTTGQYLGVSAKADGTFRHKAYGTYGSISDTLVGLPEGTDIQERRFILDTVISTQRPVADIIGALSVSVRSIVLNVGGKIALYQDRPDSYPVAVFNETNIITQTLNISGINEESLLTGIDVSYIDPTNHHAREVLRIDDALSLSERNGIENVIQIDLEGVTKRSQAIRAAQYLIADAKYSRRTVTFKTGIQASELKPGELIAISQRQASVAWGFGGLIAQDSSNANSNIFLEHITNPPITASVFTANTKPLAVRLASTRSGAIDTYIVSNTNYELTSTDNVTSGADIIRLTALQKYNHPTKSFNSFSGVWGDNHLPQQYDRWSLGEVQDPTNIYSSLTDKLFKVLNVIRDAAEASIIVEAKEYVNNVYVDSDSLINYTPQFYSDYFSPLLPPPIPNFNLQAVTKRDPDGTIYNDLEISVYTDRLNYTNEISTEFYKAIGSDIAYINTVSPTASNNILELSVDDANSFTEGSSISIYGKNGFSTNLGSINLLTTSVAIVDIDPITNPEGNVAFTIKGLDNVIDRNFGPDTHVLSVLSDFNFSSLKGSNKIGFPVQEKLQGGVGAAYGLPDFINSDTGIIRATANVIGFDLTNNIIKISNDLNLNKTIYTMLDSAPFYVTINQILDHRYFSNNYVYITGETLNIIRNNTITTSNYESPHIFKQPLGISAANKNFVQVFLDGKNYTNFVLETGLDLKANSQVNISLSTLPTSDNDISLRVKANVYTVPIIEAGDTISWNTGNTYKVTSASYDIDSPSYNAALTANSIYRIQLLSNIVSNVGGVVAVNISNDPSGFVGNVNTTSNTITFNYDANSHTGSIFGIANNYVYTTNYSDLGFEPMIVGDTSRVIKRVPVGTHIVKARNISKYGRRSPFVTKSVYAGLPPIQSVNNLTITEELYKDTTLGIAVRAIISFDHITGQEVTDYEIAYKINGTAAGDANPYTIIKVSAHGVDTTGRIQIKVDNIEKGLASDPNTMIVKVTPLNKTIVGAYTVKTVTIVGKTAAPQNVSSFSMGQSGDSLVFIWDYYKNSEGTNVDIDLLEVQIKKVDPTTDISQNNLLTLWTNAIKVGIVDARTNKTNLDIDVFGSYTYLVRTVDTSGIFSESVVYYDYTSIPQNYTSIYKAYSEDDSTGSYVSGITNSNFSEYYFPSFANSNTDGIAYDYTSTVDNANGRSSGFTISGVLNDLISYSSMAEYTTQIRDLGEPILGILRIEPNVSITTNTGWLDYSTQIGAGQVTETSASGNLRDDDFSGTLGIGHILGFSNSNAASVTYNIINKTLVSGLQGSSPANVYGIILEGNFSNDTSNANVFSLIAGTVNSNAIVLGSSWYANGKATGSNGFSNVEIAGSAYKLVNLRQWIDLTSDDTFFGAVGSLSSNIFVRYSLTDPYYANGNVDTSVFSITGSADGYTSFTSSPKTFRYFQIKYELLNADPIQGNITLDKFRYKIGLEEKSYTVTVNSNATTTFVDYGVMNYTRTPQITGVTVAESSNQIAQPQVVIIDRGIEGANISVYFANGASTHDIIGASSIYTQVDFSVTGV